MNDRATTESDDEVWKRQRRKEKKERMETHGNPWTSQTTLSEFTLGGSGEEERLSDGRRWRRWSAASSKEQLPSPVLPQKRACFDPQNPK